MNHLRARVSLCLFTLFSSFSTHALEMKFNTQDFPPFSYSVNGEVAGPAVVVIKKVCAEIPMVCTFNLLPWNRAQREVEEGKAQAMFLIGRNPERENWLYFSAPIVETTYGFFVPADDPLLYQKRSDVSGYTVGVFGPSNTARSLERIRDQLLQEGHPPITIEMRPDDESGFRKLSLKRVQAVYSNHDVGNAMIAQLGLKNIRYAGFDERLFYYIGFSKQYADKSAVDQFNAVFLRLHQQGAIGKILADYQMKEVPQKSWGER